MKKSLILMLASLIALSLAAGCKDKTKTPETVETKAPAAEQTAQGQSGTVTETMNSGGYTYVQVDTGSEKIWAAAPELQVKVSDAVVIPAGMPMKDYHSKTLDRDFDVVYFVDSIMVGGEQALSGEAKMPEGHPVVADTEPAVKIEGIEKVAGGKTVAEIFSGKADLSGKEVAVRGQVVKFSAEIMGKNWIHLQDGTGAEGTNDLTVTTTAMVKVGDTVVVTGPVVTGKDFGYGYKYDVIIEDAKVVVE
ncbi:MAG TPA: hypothetical protein VGA43_11390 [Deferrimonas sp.]